MLLSRFLRSSRELSRSVDFGRCCCFSILAGDRDVLTGERKYFSLSILLEVAFGLGDGDLPNDLFSCGLGLFIGDLPSLGGDALCDLELSLSVEDPESVDVEDVDCDRDLLLIDLFLFVLSSDLSGLVESLGADLVLSVDRSRFVFLSFDFSFLFLRSSDRSLFAGAEDSDLCFSFITGDLDRSTPFTTGDLDLRFSLEMGDLDVRLSFLTGVLDLCLSLTGGEFDLCLSLVAGVLDLRLSLAVEDLDLDLRLSFATGDLDLCLCVTVGDLDLCLSDTTGDLDLRLFTTAGDLDLPLSLEAGDFERRQSVVTEDLCLSFKTGVFDLDFSRLGILQRSILLLRGVLERDVEELRLLGEGLTVDLLSRCFDRDLEYFCFFSTLRLSCRRERSSEYLRLRSGKRSEEASRRDR